MQISHHLGERMELGMRSTPFWSKI